MFVRFVSTLSVTVNILKFEDFDKRFSTAHIDNVARDPLPGDFVKLVPLRILADGSCLYNAVSVYFSGNAGLALDLKIRTVAELLRNSLASDIPTHSN